MAAYDMFRVSNPRLLNLTVYVMVMIMCGIALISGPEGTAKITVVSLCVVFGLVHALGFQHADSPDRLAVYFVIQVMLILALMRLSYPRDVFNLLFYLLAVEAVLVLPTRTAIAWIVGFFLWTVPVYI